MPVRSLPSTSVTWILAKLLFFSVVCCRDARSDQRLCLRISVQPVCVRVCSMFSSFFNEILGNCYTFNSGWNATKVRASKKTGPRHGQCSERCHDIRVSLHFVSQLLLRSSCQCCTSCKLLLLLLLLMMMMTSGGATPGRAGSNDLAEDPPPWLRPAYCFASVIV